MDPLYLVDASSYVYRAYFALPPLRTPNGIPTNAVYGFAAMILKLLRQATPRYLVVVFDAPGETFRDELYAEYKANRPGAPEDLSAQWPLIHETVRAFRLPALSVPGVEADDVIGTLVHRYGRQGVPCVIVSSDKDLLQLVGPNVRLWDTMRDRWFDERAVRERYGVEPEKLVEVFALVGDPIDNVPGVQGIGEKTASLLVRKFGSVDALLENPERVAAEKIRGASRIAERLRAGAERARTSRRLVEVRRDVDLPCELEDFRYEGPDLAEVRRLFRRLSFDSLLRELPPPPAPVLREPERLSADAAARWLGSAPRIALACVGRGAPLRSRCEALVLSTGEEAKCVEIGDDPAASLAGVLEDPRREKVGHDLKTDAHWLFRHGMRLVGPLFDTMLASSLLGVTPRHSLEALAAEWLGENLPPFRGSQASVASVAAGVERLPRLREILGEKLEEAGCGWLFREVEIPLLDVLARMERRGVPLDRTVLERIGVEWRERLDRLRKEIYEAAGFPFNIQSPVQLREVLFERLKLPKKGVRRGKTGLSTDVDVLTRLAKEHPLPAKILDYRTYAKLLSTYVEGLLGALDPETGRLHTTFHQAVTATGRLSSSDPNLQNIPVRGEEGRRIRSAFVAPPGFRLLSADYSQIELRVMAHLSGDERLLGAFEAGLDIHAATASELLGVPPERVSADARRVAKVINFGILYGMGPQRLALELGISTSEAERYIARYFERYPGVRAFIERTVAEGKKKGYVATLFGRRRFLPELRGREGATLRAAERAAINAPVQGTAADLIKIAMVRIDRKLRDEKLSAALILQVHDELLLEVPENELSRVPELVRHEMEHAAELRAPLRVEMGWGSSWAEAHA
ncbi:MAG: DNA polymerase [Candidatus Binatia bacterium]|nr:MAG: DNA polymerase [Candidatus Binatia bacterium]